MVTTGKVVGIDYTILDGNAWIGDVDGHDMDASLDTLARETREALRREYPGAVVNVSRSRDGGAARECLVIVEDDGCEMAAEPDEVENVNAVAGDVWLDGFWYVAKSDE